MILMIKSLSYSNKVILCPETGNDLRLFISLLVEGEKVMLKFFKLIYFPNLKGLKFHLNDYFLTILHKNDKYYSFCFVKWNYNYHP